MSLRRPAASEEIACPLCGRREYVTVATADRRGRPLRTVMCEMCGLVFTNPRPTDAEVDRYYETGYRLDYSGARMPTRRKILRGLLGAVERRDGLRHLLPSGVRVLDVGCGAGEFVYLLRNDGYDASGIEPGHEYAAFCRDVLRIPTQTATVEAADIAPGSQGLITLFHMLEHVADPRRTLEVIGRWLVPGSGRLVVEVPNLLSTAQAPRHRFHYAHLFNYSAATLAEFGAAAGLRTVTTSETADGGNVCCVFALDSAGARPAAGLPSNVERTREVLSRHTTARHYLAPTPYLRVLRKLVRRGREDWLLARMPTIDAILAWSTGLTGPDTGTRAGAVPGR